MGAIQSNWDLKEEKHKIYVFEKFYFTASSFIYYPHTPSLQVHRYLNIIINTRQKFRNRLASKFKLADQLS